MCSGGAARQQLEWQQAAVCVCVCVCVPAWDHAEQEPGEVLTSKPAPGMLFPPACLALGGIWYFPSATESKQAFSWTFVMAKNSSELRAGQRVYIRDGRKPHQKQGHQSNFLFKWLMKF